MRSPDFGIVAGLAVFVLLCASLPYMSIPARVICGGELQFFSTAAIFVGDRENIPDYGRARCSAGNKLDPKLETGKVSSHGQVRKIS